MSYDLTKKLLLVDIKLYSYISNYNQYDDNENEIKNGITIQSKDSKYDKSIKRFTIDEIYIFETSYSYTLDGITIKKIN